MKFTPIIGVEVHVELKTESKMFCSCPAAHFGKKPNTQTCPVCLGLPGALPVPNQIAVEWAVTIGLALNCRVPLFSKFDRKNYFYPDLPKGYQISQYDKPLTINGEFRLKTLDHRLKTVRIRRVHLEEDTGKLIHKKEETLIDFNRSGVPLVEIVTEPDFNSSEEIKDFLIQLQQLIRYLGVSEADMEKGQMRCEPTVNLKIEEAGKLSYTPLVEIKNINSFRFVKQSIDYEVKRQLEEFQRNHQEKKAGNKTTRGWSEARGMTVLQREKEEAADYRYFPEPDIPPIRWEKSRIAKIKNSLPELPHEKASRFRKIYGLSDYQSEILTHEKKQAEFYEESMKNLSKKSGKRNVINKEEARVVANLIINKKVNWQTSKPGDLSQILQKKTEAEVDLGQLTTVINEVLGVSKKAIEDYKRGKVNALQYLIGQVMSRTRGRANPGLVKELLAKKLEKI